FGGAELGTVGHGRLLSVGGASRQFYPMPVREQRPGDPTRETHRASPRLASASVTKHGTARVSRLVPVKRLISALPTPRTLVRLVRLAAYFLDHDALSYELISRVFLGQAEGLTRDDILDNITITWLTNTALSGARLYWEYRGEGFSTPRASPFRSPSACSRS